MKENHIQKINKEYRKKDQITDVISFNTVDIENEILIKGDQKRLICPVKFSFA